jgi:hypothetical protein
MAILGERERIRFQPSSGMMRESSFQDDSQKRDDGEEKEKRAGTFRGYISSD